MTMPSESLRAVKRGRDGWRQILTSKRMSQADLKALASSILHHYPFDFNLDKYWSEALEEEASISKPKQHECCTGTDEVQHECSKLLIKIKEVCELPKYIEDEIVNVTSDKVQVNEHKYSESGRRGINANQGDV